MCSIGVMNTDLFQPLEELRVQVHADRKINPIPPIAVLESAQELLEMIDWLGSEALEDKRVTEELIYSDPAINKRPPIREKLALRMGSRTLSYINHIYLLNGILKKGLERTVELLKEHGLDEHIDKANLESELERIKQVFEPIETFRHKVAAHTSYSYPKKDDGLLQLNSLLNLTPRPGSEVLGGKSFMGGHNGDIPLVTILTYEADTESYFGEWVELYTKVLTPLQKKFTGAKGHINLDN